MQNVFIALISFIVLIGCSSKAPENSPSQEEKSIVVYSHRHYPSDQKLFAQFTEETGIQVAVRKGKADELIKKLEIEGKDTKADVLITVDIGRLYLAKNKSLLQSVKSDTLQKNIPSHLQDPDGFWYGLTKRARVIVYHKDRVNKNDLSTYETLVDPKWHKKILIRSSGNIYNQSLVASLIVANGKEKAQKWANGIVKNMARTPKGNDRDQVKAIAAGEGDLAVVNTYYIGKLLTSDNEEEKKAGQAVQIFFPNQDDRGTHINVSGAGVVASSKNKELAIRFLEFLSSEKAQKVFAESNHEYPINPKVEASELVKSWGKFKEDQVNLEELGKNNKEAVKAMDLEGWK